jgi:DNA primase
MPTSKRGAKYFTGEQLEKAKEVKVLDYMQSQGYELKKVGNWWTWKEHDSFRIEPSGKRFTRFSEGTKGGSAIDFITQYEGKNMVEAVLQLSGDCEQYKPQKAETKANQATQNADDCKENKVFKLPERAENHRRVFAYLTKTRGISPELVSKLMKEKKIFETAKHHNAAFVFTDVDGNITGASLRSTLTQGDPFKGMSPGSDRNKSCFTFGGSETAKNALIFEAPIDALSYASARMEINHDMQFLNSTYLASGGAGENNIVKFLIAKPTLETVFLCFDSDKAGNEMAARMSDRLKQLEEETGRFFNIRRQSPKAKDFNADLMNYRERKTQKSSRQNTQKEKEETQSADDEMEAEMLE